MNAAEQAGIVVDARKPYSKPQLVEYGQVGEIDPEWRPHTR
jgi:hypothetical protein